MIGIACDHGGYPLKLEIIDYLKERNIDFHDYGCYGEQAVDYPDYAKLCAEAVIEHICDKGILLCGTGIGISIAANRFDGIRCALCHDVFSAKATRLHNDSNMLAMGGRVIGKGLACEIVDAWLGTDFSREERHQRRIDMIETR